MVISKKDRYKVKMATLEYEFPTEFYFIFLLELLFLLGTLIILGAYLLFGLAPFSRVVICVFLSIFMLGSTNKVRNTLLLRYLRQEHPHLIPIFIAVYGRGYD